MSRPPPDHPEHFSPFSPELDELCAALERLYIKGNLSGRLNFRVKFPYAAPLVFGRDLLGYDEEGTRDKKHRAKLEAEAVVRRGELLTELEEIRDNSLENGMLNEAYARSIFDRFGKEFTSYVYSKEVIERLAPPQEEKTKEAPKEEVPAFVPQFTNLKLASLPREGITYRELLDSLPVEAPFSLTLTFNERAYLRLSSETV